MVLLVFGDTLPPEYPREEVQQPPSPDRVLPSDSSDGRTWVALEKVHAEELARLRDEVEFLRGMLELVLTRRTVVIQEEPRA